MGRVSDERAIWLGRHVLPHEQALRAWLRKRRLVGLEIDDVVQDTYARLIAVESVEGVRNPRSYTFQTAFSVVVSHMRRAKVVAFAAVADMDQLEAEAEEPSPERQVVDRDELQALAEAVAALPPQIAAVFRLRKIEGLTQKECAERLGLAESTVEKHVMRGYLLLAQTFTRSGPETRQTSRKAEAQKRGKAAAHGPTDRD